jgi:hypothetical protein
MNFINFYSILIIKHHTNINELGQIYHEKSGHHFNEWR